MGSGQNGMAGDWGEAFPRCPLCGEETDTLYRNELGAVVGCEGCLERIDAWEEQAGQKGR